MRLILAVSLLAALSACTWVKMEPAGNAVRVAGPGANLVACEKRGEVAVSVRHKVGLYERNEIKVLDELETLARNEAPSLAGDTVQARGAPVDGEQRFAVFRCGSAAIGDSRARPIEQVPEGEAQTFPIED